MLFYKLEGMPANTPADAEDSRRAQRENTRRIFMKTEEFNRKGHSDSYCFVSETDDCTLTVGIIATPEESVETLAQNFLQYIGCPLLDHTITETTISAIHQLLGRADRFNFIANGEEIMEKYGIDRVCGRHGGDIEFGENIIAKTEQATLFRNAEKNLMADTLLPELRRIYTGSTADHIAGHPVHYLVRTDDADVRRETYQLLLEALYANKRIRNRRYCFLNFRPGEDFSMMSLHSLCNVCDGGAMVIRYLARDDGEGGDTASTEQETIARICQVIKRHRNNVQLILCLPRECQSARESFCENLGVITFVDLQEKFAVGDQARAYLKSLAKAHHVRTNKQLFAALDPEKGYLAPELQEMFDAWYNTKLRTDIFPQYKELTIASKAAVKSAPKGSAYDELQEMIGLTEAKAVIRKALNYYKIRKLSEEKGVKCDTPVMHMVFSGNPGTAKTTAARLFARIMKDNGLLSKGQLVEVGRGDLVGKYVGWTAQTVQAKFQAARGGVLFIDEAYSLVDDRNGSFGDEAINTIVQEMENHRKDVVVIFAGYPDKMEQFLQKNPGLRSRIAFHVPFEDYNTEQLCQIAQLMGKNNGVHFEQAALDKLSTLFDIARKQQDFGNGRYVRNTLEQAKMNQASRLLEGAFEDITADEIKTIRAADILIPEVKTEPLRTIGFAC